MTRSAHLLTEGGWCKTPHPLHARTRAPLTWRFFSRSLVFFQGPGQGLARPAGDGGCTQPALCKNASNYRALQTGRFCEPAAGAARGPAGRPEPVFLSLSGRGPDFRRLARPRPEAGSGPTAPENKALRLRPLSRILIEVRAAPKPPANLRQHRLDRARGKCGPTGPRFSMSKDWHDG